MLSVATLTSSFCSFRGLRFEGILFVDSEDEALGTVTVSKLVLLVFALVVIEIEIRRTVTSGTDQQRVVSHGTFGLGSWPEGQRLMLLHL